MNPKLEKLLQTRFEQLRQEVLTQELDFETEVVEQLGLPRCAAALIGEVPPEEICNCGEHTISPSVHRRYTGYCRGHSVINCPYREDYADPFATGDHSYVESYHGYFCRPLERAAEYDTNELRGWRYYGKIVAHPKKYNPNTKYEVV